MAKQGGATRQFAASLAAEGWAVLFTCIPNSAHVGVVPIPTATGSSKQRYPDIVALRGECLLLVEVEVSLTDFVATDIRLRFDEMHQALADPGTYALWATRVTSVHGSILPPHPTVLKKLLVMRGFPASLPSVATLNASGIEVIDGTRTP